MNTDIAYLSNILSEKGYGNCNVKLEWIEGRPWAILYLSKQRLTELFAQKVNMELGLPLAIVKTEYTGGVLGLNVTNIFQDLLENIHSITDSYEPVNESHVHSIDRIFKYFVEKFPTTVERCKSLHLENPFEVVAYVNAIHNCGLCETPDGRFFVPEEVEL